MICRSHIFQDFIRSTSEQAVAASIKYFDLGDISFRDANNNPLGDFNPREFAFDATYSRKLSEEIQHGSYPPDIFILISQEHFPVLTQNQAIV